MASDTPADFSAPIDAVSDVKKVDALDGGWDVESHSKETDAPAVDTTAASAGDDGLDDLAESAPGREPGAKPVVAAKAAPAAAARPKKKQTFQERIDELTGKNGQATRELTAERQKTADLERRLTELERRPASAVAQPAAVAAPAARAAAAPDPLALPDPPKYIDFDTDEEYQKAVSDWRTKSNEVMTAREAKIKADVTADVDGRFAKRNEQEQRAAAEGAVLDRIKKVGEVHPDFGDLVSANPDVFAAITRERAPFIHDIITNTGDGGELFYDLAKEPEMALALAELPLPTRPLADAVRTSPASRSLMKHFATDAGREDFLRLRTLHPLRVLAEVGKLEQILEAADSGSASRVTRPITSAVPPARPPVGTPRARETQAPGSPKSFDDWMADEDAKELAEKRAAIGATATA